MIGSMSIYHWLIVLLVVVLLFGTKKLRNVGTDLGSAIKSFRKGLADDEPGKLEKDKAGNEAASRQSEGEHERERPQ